MSAFIVSSDCINSIVTYLHKESDRFDWLTERTKINVAAKSDLPRMASALHQLNCEAIGQRYTSVVLRSDLKGQHFYFRPVERPAIAVYKAVSCLLYQCMEGDVPEQDLYQVLELISHRIAMNIVEALPEYDAAPWGD